MLTSPTAVLETANERIFLLKLNEFGFVAAMEAEKGDTGQGVLLAGDVDFSVDYQVRSLEAGIARCSFVDMSREQQMDIRKYLDSQSDEPESASSPVEQPIHRQVEQDPQPRPVRASDAANHRSRNRGLAKAALGVLAIVVGGGMGWYWYQTPADSELANAAAATGPEANPKTSPADTKQPIKDQPAKADHQLTDQQEVAISLPADATVAELLVQTGQSVNRGDVLAKVFSGQDPVRNQLKLKDEKIEALTGQLDSFRRGLDTNRRRLEMSVKSLESRRRVAEQKLEAATEETSRLRPYLESGAISRSEYADAQKDQFAAQAELEQVNELIQQAKFSLESATQGVMVSGDSVDDGLQRLQSQIELVEAEKKELLMSAGANSQRPALQEITAPVSGTIVKCALRVGDDVSGKEPIFLIKPGADPQTAAN